MVMWKYLALGFTMAWTSAAWAGNNAHGQAYVSISTQDIATELAESPAKAFPVYVHIDGAPDIAGLSLRLGWAPADGSEGSYEMVSPLEITSGDYGYATLDAPSAQFPGDSAFTSTIVLPKNRGAKTVIAYWFRRVGEAPVAKPASFCLFSAKTLDSKGG
jgi:hypothetical protein